MKNEGSHPLSEIPEEQKKQVEKDRVSQREKEKRKG